jgi:hypothetical protein
MRRPSNRTTVIAVSALVAVCAAAFIAVTLVGHARDRARADRTPPPLGSHAADVLRLPVVAAGPPSLPTGYAKRADGTQVALGVEDVGEDGPGRAVLLIRDGADRSLVPKSHTVKVGDTFTEFGVRVKVLRIWTMPNPRHNAVDVQADPA